MLLRTSALSTRSTPGGAPIPITPEVPAPTKKPARRSTKARRDDPSLLENSTPGSARAAEPAAIPAEPLVNGSEPRPAAETATAPAKPPYEWDRTVAERAEQEEKARIQKLPFPTPRSKTLPPPDWFKYWGELIKLPQSKYARLYVRRWFPAQLPEEKEDGAFGLKKEVHPSEVRWDADQGELSEEKILSLLGVGDYTIRLNDTRLAWTQQTVVSMEKLSTARNWDTYPPVMDYARLDWTDSANQVFIKWAISRNRLKRPEEGESEDMANGTVVDRVLTDANQRAAQADQILTSEVQRLRTKNEELEAELRKKGETPPVPVAASGSASDLATLGTALTTIITAIKPAPDNSLTAFLQLEKERETTRAANEQAERDRLRTEAQAERARADTLQKELLDDLRAARTAPAAAAAAAAPLTQVGILEEAIKVRDLTRRLSGGKDPDDPPEEPPLTTMDRFLEAAPVLAPVINGFGAGLFALGMGLIQGWRETSYNEALVKLGHTDGASKLKPPADSEAKPGEPVKPAPPKAPPEEQLRQQRFNKIMSGVQKLIRPIFKALEAGQNGVDFADEIMISPFLEGRVTYDTIRALPEALTEIQVQLQGEPGTVNQFLSACATALTQLDNGVTFGRLREIPTFQQFLVDFYNYDAMKAKQEEKQDNA